MQHCFCFFKCLDKSIWHKYNKSWEAVNENHVWKKKQEALTAAGLPRLIKRCLQSADGRTSRGIYQSVKYLLSTYIHSYLLCAKH